ncbi:anti-sigma factor family protein [Streptomyces sp. NPDC001339]|uniref:anti-sigma factor family protein n=1 Tax=Streptomyces sp. NPDC001339 TaxID=3364563 RepID=UPI0036769C4A
MSLSGGPSPAEQHLGDRLAALVDGELGHDARERVLAHLATCGKCKAEADAQRRLKSVFAEAPLPGPSAGLLARLQQLPGGDSGGPGSRLGAGGFGNAEYDRGGAFGYVPSDSHSRRALAAVPAQGRPRGFRGPDAERPVQRRRFAFAAAGAVSLAAFALGGALPLEAAVEPGGGRGEGGGTAVTPLGVSPAADGGSLPGSSEFLRTGTSREWTWPTSGGPTPVPAPSAMALYGPGTAPAPSASAVARPAGHFGPLSPLIAATRPVPAYHPAPPVAATDRAPVPRNPSSPLEPGRPLLGSAAAAHGPAAAQR